MLDREPDWHPLAPEARNDPAATQAALRERCPIAWTDDLGGFWSVLRYEDVVAVARDTDTFSNALKPRLGAARVPLETDRPGHTRFDFEDLLVLDPDVLVVPGSDDPNELGGTARLVGSDPALAGLRARRRGLIVALPGWLFSTNSQHIVTAAEELARRLDAQLAQAPP